MKWILSNLALRLALVTIAIPVILTGCALGPAAHTITVERDNDNCDRPVLGFELTREEFKLVVKKSYDVALMKVDYLKEKKLIKLISKATNDKLVMEYLICHAIAAEAIPKENRSQRIWIRKRFEFLNENPNINQIANWDHDNQFPKGKPFSLGKPVPPDTSYGLLTNFIIGHDIPYFIKHGDPGFESTLAPEGSRFYFRNWYENGYLISFTKIPTKFIDDAGKQKTTTPLPLVTVNENDAFEIPRENFIEGTDYRYDTGVFHGPVIVPLRAYSFSTSSKMDLRSTQQPVIGYVFGPNIHVLNMSENVSSASAPRITMGYLLGLGVSNISAKNITTTNTSNEVAWTPLAGFGMGLGAKFFMGIFVGFDHIFGTTGDNWEYQNKPWVGLAAAWNFGG